MNRYLIMFFLVVALNISCVSNTTTPQDNIVTSKANERYVVNGDGTVTDLKTNLMWLNEPKFFAVVPYEKAVIYCQDLSYNNFSDWRLPTATEFNSIMDKSQLPPTLIPGHPFKNITPNLLFWTQTQHEKTHYRVWVVNLYNGKIRDQSKENMGIVWPVRDIE